jgi:hypothetical protein
MTQHHPSQRRTFIGQLGISAAAVGGALVGLPDTASANDVVTPLSPHTKWDMSWVKQLQKAKFRMVVDASTLEGGYALDVVSSFLQDYREVYGTRDEDTRGVVVIRRLGTPLALGDALWDRYSIGEDTKTTDPVTKEPARRNPYIQGSPDSGTTINALRARGTIFLLCNVAMTNWSRRMAEKAGRSADDVRNDVLANLSPGVIVMPTGLFALIRAQNAGCAYMRGT